MRCQYDCGGKEKKIFRNEWSAKKSTGHPAVIEMARAKNRKSVVYFFVCPNDIHDEMTKLTSSPAPCKPLQIHGFPQ